MKPNVHADTCRKLHRSQATVCLPTRQEVTAVFVKPLKLSHNGIKPQKTCWSDALQLSAQRRFIHHCVRQIVYTPSYTAVPQVKGNERYGPATGHNDS